MLLFPELTQLDFADPYEIFSRLLNGRVYLLAPTLDPIYSESRLTLQSNTNFGRWLTLDVLFVPGGLDVNVKLKDTEFLDFLKFQGSSARYVTSVSTDSLLLAAGLLQGYRATTHCFSLERLTRYGEIETVVERVVRDRSRTIARGMAGIDLALVLATELFGVTVAQEI